MKNIHIRKQTGILLCILFALALSACTSKNITEPAEPAKQTFGAAPIQKSEEAEAVMESQSEEIAEDNRFCGQWILAGYEYGERENAGDTPIRTPYYLAGDEGEESKIHIYSEGDQLYADYYHCQNEGTTTINGMAFEEETTTTEDQPAARLKNRMDESEIRRTVTLLEDNVLQYREQYYGMTSDYTYNGIYMREGSKELEQRSEYQYLDVVTVSTVEELVEAIQDRTKVILKGGEYNFSSLDDTEIQNPKLDAISYYDEPAEYTIKDLHNFCMEAANGEKVVVSTASPYGKVLAFEGCDNITVRGLTCGHEVEPGYCTGSVIYLSETNNVMIDDCHLYGSGTYGVEAHNSRALHVEGTELFDCTYGLLELDNVTAARFQECTFRDSKQYNMFSFQDCYNILLQDCLISGNHSDAGYFPFISAPNSYKVLFKNCEFKENTYSDFLAETDSLSMERIVFENCLMDDGEIVNTFNEH